MLKIISGVEKNKPIKTCIYGAEGIGKSTLASQMPKPLFLDTEGGTSQLDINRVKISTWQELLGAIKEVIANPDICKTLVIDTADWAETMCVKYVCFKGNVNGIEDFGFGKGYTYLAEEFKNMLTSLSQCCEVGINPVIVAHGKPRKFELPDEKGSFDRWEMKLSKQCSPLVKEWCDILLFCNYKTIIADADKNGKGKAKGGQRVMYASHHPCWDAKNRFGLPDQMLLDYSLIAKLYEGKEQPKIVEKPKAEPKKVEEPKNVEATNIKEEMEKVIEDLENDRIGIKSQNTNNVGAIDTTDLEQPKPTEQKTMSAREKLEEMRKKFAK